MPTKKSAKNTPPKDENTLNDDSAKHDAVQDELLETNQNLTEDLKRVQAEFINYKRRVDEERPQQIRLGKVKAVSSLLPVIDNVERALAHIPNDIADHEYFNGLKGVLKQLHTSLNELGVRHIQTVGERFDPETMNAVATTESDHESDTVVEELQSGYMVDDVVIREAMVKVAA